MFVDPDAWKQNRDNKKIKKMARDIVTFLVNVKEQGKTVHRRKTIIIWGKRKWVRERDRQTERKRETTEYIENRQTNKQTVKYKLCNITHQ